jgi:DedD protein
VPEKTAYVAPSMGGKGTPAKPGGKPEKSEQPQRLEQTKTSEKSDKPASTATPAVAAASRPALHTAGPVLPPPTAKASPAAILAGASADKPSDAAAGGRFVVQVGAFLEDAKVREARSKVEKLGMKTYTQPVDTPTGKRIRVRVGPYATKAEADKVAARIKAEGQQAVVLAL